MPRVTGSQYLQYIAWPKVPHGPHRRRVVRICCDAHARQPDDLRRAAINEYAAKLHSLGPLLWVARIGLLVMAAIHIWAAVKLSSENKKARQVRYEGAWNSVDVHRKNQIVSRYASAR